MALQVNTGENIQYKGDSVKVTSQSAAYITVVTENGETISVPKNSALLSFGNNDELNEYLAENKEKIKSFKQDWNVGRDLKWGAIKQLGSFWRNLGLCKGSFDKLNSDQLAQYNSYEDQRSAGISQMISASSGVHRTVHNSLSAISSSRTRG